MNEPSRATPHNPDLYVPLSAPEDWRRLLGDPEKHWRDGYSAKETARSWMGCDGMPSSVQHLIESCPAFQPPIRPLIVIPEHKIPLDTLGAPSQADVFVLLRDEAGLLAMTVEAKVDEPFGEFTRDWLKTPNQRKRLDLMAGRLGVPTEAILPLRYQLIHRTVGALIEAERFHAKRAIMLVQAFGSPAESYRDYRAFARALDFIPAEAQHAQLVGPGPRTVDGMDLFVGWVQEPRPAGRPDLPRKGLAPSHHRHPDVAGGTGEVHDG